MSITLRSALILVAVELFLAGTVELAHGQADSGSRVRITTHGGSPKRMVGRLTAASCYWL
jgi:hypothetical protein